MPNYCFERMDAEGNRIHKDLFYPLEERPAYGASVTFGGFEWIRVMENRSPPVRIEPETIAHSMPRRGDPRDPGAPRYDRRRRPVLITTEEKQTYAKKYEQHNREPCRFERTSSQGAFGDEE